MKIRWAFDLRIRIRGYDPSWRCISTAAEHKSRSCRDGQCKKNGQPQDYRAKSVSACSMKSNQQAKWNMGRKARYTLH